MQEPTQHPVTEPLKPSNHDHWPYWLRRVGSCAIVLHLLAVFSAPWADPPPSSELSRWVAGGFRPYAQFMSLNNGYRFFAPDPGPGHLIRYEVVGPSGVIEKGRFPDREKHWPRLLYHRHFMISEMTAQMADSVPRLPTDQPPEAIMSRKEFNAYQKAFQDMRLIQQSLADYFLLQHPDATSVRLFAQTHLIPSPSQLAQGVRLTDERLYEEILLGEYRKGNR